MRPALPGSSSVIATGPPSARVSRSSRSRTDADFSRPGRRPAVLRLPGLLDQRLGGADRQLALHHLAGRPLDLGGLVEREQRAGVAHRQPLVLDQLADRRRQLEQPDRVGDRAAVLADPLGDRVLGQPELVDQPLVRRRLLERPQVGALQVLDQRALQRRALLDVLDHDRDLVQPGALRRPPAPLAGDQEVAAVGARPHHQRHDHAVRLHRVRQLAELGLVEPAPRLLGAGVELLDPGGEVGLRAGHRGRRVAGVLHGGLPGRDRPRVADRPDRRGRRSTRQQRRQPAAEAALLRFAHHGPHRRHGPRDLGTSGPRDPPGPQGDDTAGRAAGTSIISVRSRNSSASAR